MSSAAGPLAAEAANAALRARLGALVRAEPPLDVVVTHIEVNDRHGVGVLLRKVFAGEPDVLSIRSQDHFGGEQDFGRRRLLLAHSGARPEIYRRTLDAVGAQPLRRILCVPYYPADAWTALALRDTHGLPLCTWLMDDQNVHADGIPDGLMRELLARSDLRLAISSELRAAYVQKYGLPFAVVPPVVDGRLVLASPAVPSAAAPSSRRGVIVGNVWGQRWLELLRQTVRGSGITLDWYCNSGLRWVDATPAALAADGLGARGPLPDDELVPVLRECPFAVIPSGTLDETDDRKFIALLSLPSRIPYILATSHVPILVLGDPRTAAARFVTRHGVGLVAEYATRSFLAAVEEIMDPGVQERMRRRASELAPGFRADGVLEWIWRSLEEGGPVDDRFERLLGTDG